MPEGAEFPDLVQFDNNLFLIRLVSTSTGKLTLPRMDSYPIQMKEGLLPQDLVLPGNLFIPAELKVILGALPYNPQAGGPDEEAPQGKTAVKPKRNIPKTVYLSNLSTTSLIAMDPDQGTVQGRIPFNCVPSSINASSDDKLLFATCLTTDEVVVVDTVASLIKTRIPVGSKPSHTLVLEDSNQLVVSNRYSTGLNLVNLSDLSASSETIGLSPNGAPPGTTVAGATVMTYAPHRKMLYVADSATGKPGRVYEVDVASRAVKRTFLTSPAVSGLTVPPGTEQLWVSSRTSDVVEVIDLRTGNQIKKYEVGQKPVALVSADDRVLVLSAGSDRIDVLKAPYAPDAEEVKFEPITLPEGSFPSGIALSGDRKLAYISAAGSEALYMVDILGGRMFKSIPLDSRATMVTLIGGEKAPVADLPAVKSPPAAAAAQDGASESLPPLEVQPDKVSQDGDPVPLPEDKTPDDDKTKEKAPKKRLFQGIPLNPFGKKAGN
jgi:DNA-binding beta-propeller fold protein YncE